jgi:hypothetical protein
MINYYELLGMIKEGNIPNKIKVHLTPCTSKIYVREDDLDESFSYYRLDKREKEDENYRDYLSDCYLETTALDETIEILDEKKIGKLELEDDGNTITLFGEKENEWTILNNVDVIICNKINEIIDKINKEE